MKIATLIDNWRRLGLMGWAESRYGWILEDGRPIEFTAWQRAVLEADRKHRPRILTIHTIKKAGKTTTNSIHTAYRWLVIPGLHLCVGNDQAQSQDLQIHMITRMVQNHPVLRQYVKINRNELIFEPTGSRLVSLPMDYAGISGVNSKTVSLTEIWAFIYEANRRLFEELTLPPDPEAKMIIDSYAGFEAESELLREIWDRGLAGELVSDEWPIYQIGRQLSYIHTGPDAQLRCFSGTPEEAKEYYAEQQMILRPNAYRRLHLNEWVSAEDILVTAAQFDALILAGYSCPLPDKGIELILGVDLATKRDSSAVVSVYRSEGQLWLGPYRIFKPPAELTAVADYIYDLAQKYTVRTCFFDPYQAILLMELLRRQRVNVAEYPQTVPNLVKAGNSLWDVIKQGQLVVYAGCDDLRQHLLNARAKETARGIQLIKDPQRHYNDAAVALAIAVVNASQERPSGKLEMHENPFYGAAETLGGWWTQDPGPMVFGGSGKRDPARLW